MMKKLVTCLALSAVLATNVYCQTAKKVTEKQIVKVDFDFSQRRVEEVNDTSYNSWPISEQKEAEKTFNKVTFKLKGNFNSKWYKVGISAPFYSKLASDGLATAENLELVIHGLKEGQHSLLTFHNTFDKIEGKTFSPVKIYVNDKLAATVVPSNRVNSTIEAATAYLIFNAEAAKDVVIRFELDSKSDSFIQQMVINGFEIDTPNLKQQSHTPMPENANEHVVIDKNLMLNWQSSKDAVAHKLYYGTDKKAVSGATEKSSEFKGKLTQNNYS
ncbi:MAG TPA: T9SS C-terminal target domain-containing protein, partial [Flavobacterium sp.]